MSLGVSICAVHQVLCSLIFGGFLQILQTFQTETGANIVTYDISTYQRRLTAMPFVPGPSYNRATLGANGVALMSNFVMSGGILGLSLQRHRRRRPVSQGYGAFSRQHCVVSADPSFPGAMTLIVINPCNRLGDYLAH